MLARLLTFVVWAAVAGSGVFWGLKLADRPQALPAHAVIATPGLAADADLSRLFGATPEAAAAAAPPSPPESSRFQLVGVVAPYSAAARAQGVALIAVDGKTARAFRIGAVVDGDHVLQSVQARAVAIGPRGGPALISLELPLLPPPSTGVPGALPMAMPAPAPGAPPVPGAPGMVPGVMPGVVPGVVPPQLAVPPRPGAAMPTPNAAQMLQSRLQGLRSRAVTPTMAPPAGADGPVPVEVTEPQAPSADGRAALR
jgi:general secretion pathway protein C